MSTTADVRMVAPEPLPGEAHLLFIDEIYRLSSVSEEIASPIWD